MGPSLFHAEISEKDWFMRMRRIEAAMKTPWARVANNIFYSSQWVGREVLEKPQRRYFALVVEKQIACCVGIYRLSPKVIRPRGFFCEPEWRQQGLMRRCLEESLRLYRGSADRALCFSPTDLLPFHKRLKFEPIRIWTPRALEFFDFETNKYCTAEEVLLLERRL